MTMPKFKPIILYEDCAPRRVLELFSVKWTTMVLHSLHFNGGTCRTGALGRRLPGCSKKKPPKNVPENETDRPNRSKVLSGWPADGRILPDAHGPALHRADRDALCVGGQERRRVGEAQAEAEEAHGFERQSEEDSIILSHDRPIKSAVSTSDRRKRAAAIAIRTRG